MRRRAFIGAAGLVIVGCAIAVVGNDAVDIVVDNDFMDGAVTVYVRAGETVRLGQLAPGMGGTLRMPRRFLGRKVAFVLEPTGRRGTRIYTELDAKPLYGPYSYAVRDVPFPVGTSEIRLYVAPRLGDSHVRGWR